MKKGCRDLYIINYRFHGLAAKNCKTQKIVLTNKEKFRVRSEKDHGGAGLKRCNRSRGFSANFTRHRKIHDNYRFLWGLICKSSTAQPWWPVPAVFQIPVVLGHGRSRGAGQKKEDVEGIRFHTLLTAGMHRGARISPEKLQRRLCSVRQRFC
jgi:hypothetical protein